MSLGQMIQTAQGANQVLADYEKYLMNRDKQAEREALNEIMDIPERNREGTWSASAQGGCLRAQQFTFLGFPKKRPDERTMNIFANGDYVHLRHQAFGIAAGYIAETEVPVADETYRLRGTMDGLLMSGNGLEIKSINDYGFGEVNTYGVKFEHRYQMHAYMLCRPDITVFHAIYENKNTNQLREFMVRREPKIIDELRRDLDQLNEETDAKRLIPMLQECKNMKGKYRWCPFAPICEDAEINA